MTETSLVFNFFIFSTADHGRVNWAKGDSQKSTISITFTQIKPMQSTKTRGLELRPLRKPQTCRPKCENFQVSLFPHILIYSIKVKNGS